MDQLTITEQFDGHSIAFHAGDAFVNLTTMCAAFGKRANDFMAISSTKAFSEALAEDLGVLPSALVIGRRGSLNGGTWAHPDLAMKCAGWLAPKFEVWMMRTIRKILNGDAVATSATDARITRLELEILELRRAAIDREMARLTAPVNSYGELSKDGRPKTGYRGGCFTVKGGERKAMEIHVNMNRLTQITFNFDGPNGDFTATLTQGDN